MKHVVVLGAGFGGLTIATELDKFAETGKIKLTLIDRNISFSMGFSMQWVLAGRRNPDEGKRVYSSLRSKHVNFVNDEILSIDTENKVVYAKTNQTKYDYLVIALGADLITNAIPGLESAYNLCDMQSIIQLKQAVEKIESGVIVISIASVPFKCPAAPYEYALLIDDILRKRKVRDKIRVIITTPESQPLPVAGRDVGNAVVSMLAERKIEFLAIHKPKTIDKEKRKILYENGYEFDYDVLCTMPPHRAPSVVSNLTDSSGFIPVDLFSMKTFVSNVYAVGDVTAMKLPEGMPHPKAGIFAEAQALLVARNIEAEIEGTAASDYQPRGICYIDIGDEKAMPAEADLFAPEGRKIQLHQPSESGLEGKRNFEKQRLEKWFE